MSDKIKELEEDIQELQKLLLDAQRPNVQNHLAQHISKLKTQMDNLQSIQKAPQAQKPIPVSVSTPHKEEDRVNYQPLTKYAWEQEGPKVKLIFLMDGVGKQCTKEQINVTFLKDSVEMKLRGYNGQNLIFAVRKLHADIKPQESKYLLKNNAIYLILIKKENKHWDQVAYKESKFKADEKEEKVEDPSAGLMNMMKKMYEDGDENMKRSIAEAWTKANDKKGEKPDFSDRYDFLNK